MDFRTPAECLDHLKRLNPINVDEAQQTLSDMLEALLKETPAPNQYLEVLEAMRTHLDLIQSEVAKRYAAHPLPPDSVENQSFRKVVALWQLMAHSYAQITRRDAAAGTLDDQRSLLSQRRVFYSGQALLEYFRAHRAIPEGLWGELHESFSMAEAQGIARIRVSDPLNEVWRAQSATEAYISFLLVDLANPFGRGEREFTWVCRWAQRFAPYCTLQNPAESAEPVKPTTYGLDLAMDHGLRPIGLLTATNTTLRRFDGSRLAGQIQAVLTQFKQGVKPAALGLGEDCPVEASSRLLLSLYRPWGLASVGRRFPRRGCRGEAELTGDWLAIGFHVQGKLFEQPGGLATQRSLRSDITLLTFGERAAEVGAQDSEQQRRREAAKLGFACEHWELLDQSVGGFRLRQLPPSERLEHRQLVGIRPPDGERFLLGLISWLMYRADGTLESGVSILNGLPKVVAVRQVGLNPGHRGAYQQAFLLPEVPALKTPASLVLPGAWFQPHRVVEMHDGKQKQLRLTQLLTRGANFDQVSFETLNGS